MNSLILYLLGSILINSVIADSCYLLGRGFGPEQWTGLRSNDTHTIITMGEIPVKYPGVGFITQPLSCIHDGLLRSSGCDATLDRIIPDGSNILFGIFMDSINNGSGNVTMSDISIEYMASGIRYIIPKVQWSNDTWIIFIIGMLPVGSLTRYKASGYNGAYYIYAVPFSSLSPTDLASCDSFDYFVSISRWTVYDNLRYMRYGALMFIGIIALVVAYFYWYSIIMIERRFSLVVSMCLIMTYSATGFYFAYYDLDFSGIEYAYYVSMAILYFSSFIRYVFKKYVQERSFKLYNKIYAGTNYKLEETSIRVRRNNRIEELLETIPSDYINSIILWIIVIIAAPTIQLLIPSTSYPAQLMVVSIVKFAFPVIAVLLPGLAVLVWSLVRFKRTEANISFYKVLVRFFGMYDDPLVYRTEFMLALLICLPLAIITFVIGNLDPLIPNYILFRRIIQLVFHAIIYTLFDISFALLLTGFYAVLIWLRRTRNIDITFNETTSATSETRKLSTRDLILSYALSDPEGREIIAEFSKSTDNYPYYRTYKFMEDLSLKLTDSTTPEMLNFFFKSMLKDTIYRMIATKHGLLDANGSLDPSRVISKDIGLIISDIMESASDRLFTGITKQGILRVKEFYLYCQEKEAEIKAYLLSKRQKLKEINLEELDLNDEEALERQNSDEASYAYDLSA